MMFTGLLWLLVVVLIARWFFPPHAAGRLPPDWARRTDGELERLREEVARLSGEVERLTEEQSFLLRLLDAGEPPRTPQLPRPAPQDDPESHS